MMIQHNRITGTGSTGRIFDFMETPDGTHFTTRPAVMLVGASARPDRYAFKAFAMLKEYGYPIVPVAPALSELDSVPVIATISQATRPIHTVTLYVGPSRLEPMVNDLVTLAPVRVIFNPGTESPAAQDRLRSAGIVVIEACTLVLLRTGQFDSAGLDTRSKQGLGT